VKYLIFTIAAIVFGGIAYVLGRTRSAREDGEGVDVAQEHQEESLEEAQNDSQENEDELDDKLDEAQQEADRIVDNPPDDMGHAYDELLDDLRADD